MATEMTKSASTKSAYEKDITSASRRSAPTNLEILVRLLLVLVMAAASLASVSSYANAEPPARPNILWISCEDISSNLGCYGDQDAKTPNIDALAREGVRFTHAFTTCPVCATNRSSIITGMYPTSIGTHLMRCNAKLPAHIKCFPEYLREAGYYCTNDAKTDYNFTHNQATWDANGHGSHWRNRPAGKPFFHVRNFGLTHESRIWPRGEAHLKQTPHLQRADRRDPSNLTLPPYYPDTPEVRRDWANYHENITELDYRVAELLQELEDDGLADDTIIFFWSDHGVGLPRGKRWLYDSGTRVPLIVVIPEKYRVGEQGQPGRVSSELISFVDFAPTVLNLCGVTPPEHMQGQAFLGQGRDKPRDYLVSTRDRMDERYDMIRTIRVEEWRYTRNYMPWKPYSQWLGYAEINTTMKALRRLQAAGTLSPKAARFMATQKPIEELYHTRDDPHEVNNLAQSDRADAQAMLTQLRGTLDAWQTETNDLGFLPEPDLVAGEKEHGSRHAIGQTPEAKQRITRLRKMMDAAARGDRELLERGLQATDAAERYWAVVGLGQTIIKQGAEKDGPTAAAPWLKKMQTASRDSSPAVRIAAAENLCRLGRVEQGLAILADALNHEEASVRLTAAIALDELDELAKPVVKNLYQALKSKRPGYFGAVVARTLAELND